MTDCLQQAGRDDAKRMLGLDQEEVGAMVQEWLGDYELKEKFPFFQDYLQSVHPL